MARRDVVELQCDRCGKPDLQPPDQPVKEGQREFTLEFRGRRIVFADLCRKCRATISNYCDMFDLEQKKQSRDAAEGKQGAKLKLAGSA